jgi:hypothetical protein
MREEKQKMWSSGGTLTGRNEERKKQVQSGLRLEVRLVPRRVCATRSTRLGDELWESVRCLKRQRAEALRGVRKRARVRVRVRVRQAQRGAPGRLPVLLRVRVRVRVRGRPMTGFISNRSDALRRSLLCLYASCFQAGTRPPSWQQSRLFSFYVYN